jgi:hypothetical protein
MSVAPRKRRKVRALTSVAKGHGGGRREPLRRPVMMVARFTAQSPRTRLAFERSFPAITLDAHLQDGAWCTSRSMVASVMAWTEKILPHSPKEWLAVIGLKTPTMEASYTDR